MIQLTFEILFETCFKQLKMSSIATPLIATGQAAIPIKECVNDFLNALQNFTQNFKSSYKKTIFIVNNNINILTEVDIILQDKLKSLVKIEDCVICMDEIENPLKLSKCSHIFCKNCIQDYFNRVKKVCPICNTIYGLTEGNQPPGTMNWTILNSSLPGFANSTRTIQITYSFPNGIQNAKHPNPGKSYSGTTRIAYLPDTPEGNRVLNLLRKAFENKLVFTIGQSRTTGLNDVVTWNDIHHKTHINGGPSAYGYPDPTYLNRVLQELADKGIS